MTGPAVDAGFVFAMTAETPAHLQADGAFYTIHCCYIVMTHGTVQLRTNVHHVREIDVLRELVDPNPLNGLFVLDGIHQFDDFRTIRGYEHMAGLAG